MKPAMLASALVTLGLAGLLGYAVVTLEPGAGLAAAVRSRLDETAVAHPVTAVLLDFRSYDTWFELIVLWLAAMGVLSGHLALGPGSRRYAREPLVTALLGALVPVFVLAAVYLLARGSYAAGGAFQAGAVLAAAIVLLHLAGRDVLRLPLVALRLLLVAGIVLFALVALRGIATGALLRYSGELVALALETTAAFSIAATLAAIVASQLAQTTDDGGDR